MLYPKIREKYVNVVTYEDAPEAHLGKTGLKQSLTWFTVFRPLPTRLKGGQILDEYAHTLRLLSAAGLVVYPIDTVMETDNPSYSSQQGLRMSVTRISAVPSRMQVVQNFMEISRRTGGGYCLLRKDPDLCFSKAIGYTARYYLLAYYAEHSTAKRWHNIAVKVNRPDVVVRARSGYFSGGSGTDSEDRRKRDIAQALTSPIEYGGIPLTFSWIAGDTSPHPGASENVRQARAARGFTLRIDPSALAIDLADRNHIRLTIIAVALDRSGKMLGNSSQQIELHPEASEFDRLRRTGLLYSSAIEAPPGACKLRFIVRDDLGIRMGSVSVIVDSS